MDGWYYPWHAKYTSWMMVMMMTFSTTCYVHITNATRTAYAPSYLLLLLKSIVTWKCHFILYKHPNAPSQYLMYSKYLYWETIISISIHIVSVFIMRDNIIHDMLYTHHGCDSNCICALLLALGKSSHHMLRNIPALNFFMT